VHTAEKSFGAQVIGFRENDPAEQDKPDRRFQASCRADVVVRSLNTGAESMIATANLKCFLQWF
jgi:hypothetical protein